MGFPDRFLPLLAAGTFWAGGAFGHRWPGFFPYSFLSLPLLFGSLLTGDRLRRALLLGAFFLAGAARFSLPGRGEEVWAGQCGKGGGKVVEARGELVVLRLDLWDDGMKAKRGPRALVWGRRGLEEGDRVRWEGCFRSLRLREERWVLRRGVEAALEPEILRLERRGFWGLLRRALAAGADRVFPPSQAGVLKSMLLGETRFLSPSGKEDFRRSGLSHLLAVSGMHVSLLAGLLLSLLRPFLGEPWRGLVSAASAFGVAFLAGMSPPAARAALMFALASLSRALGYRGETVNWLGVSVLLLLLFSPGLSWEAGFQMSVAATGGILLLSPSFRLSGFLGQVLAVSLSAQLFVLPLLWFHFQSFPAYSLPANLLAAPLASLALPLGALASALYYWFPSLARTLGAVASLALEGLSSVARAFSLLPGADLHLPPPSPFLFWLLWGLLLLVLHPSLLPWRFPLAVVLYLLPLAMSLGRGEG